LEVRLDPEMRSKLEEVAAARGSSVPELVRSLIVRMLGQEEVADAARLAAAERIRQMRVEDVPEPAELKRQFSEAHGASPPILRGTENFVDYRERDTSSVNHKVVL
jgi:plasmid stability protein